MADPNAGLTPAQQSGAATRAWNVTKSDSVAIDPVPRAIYVGTGGDVVVDTLGGDVNTIYKNVPAGTTILVRATKIKAASTASDFVAKA